MAAIILPRREAGQGDLPPVCMVCGREADGYRIKRFLSRWPTIPLRAPLCREHWHHWHHRSRILLAGTLVSAVVLLVGILLVLPPVPEPLTMFGALFTILGFIAIMATIGLYIALDHSLIRVTAADRHTITLAGVANGFVVAYVEYLAGRRERTPPVSAAATAAPDERLRNTPASAPSDGAAVAPPHQGNIEAPLKYQLTEEDYLDYYVYFWERERRLHSLGCGLLSQIFLLLAPIFTGIFFGIAYFPFRALLAAFASRGEADLIIVMIAMAVVPYVAFSLLLLGYKWSEKGIRDDRKIYRACVKRHLLSYDRKGLIHLGYDFEVRLSAGGFVEVNELRNSAAEGVEVCFRIETRVNWSAVAEIIVIAEHLFVSIFRRRFLVVPRTAFVDESAFLVYADNVRRLHRAATAPRESRAPDLDLLPSVNEQFSPKRMPD